MSVGSITRPALRWHGGKWILAPWIISHFPQHRIYVEPFGGGASVLLRKERSYAEVYNDLDGDAVNFFTVMRDSGDELIERLRLTPFARAEHAGSYEPTPDPIERARRMVIRSFMGFGSNGHNRATGFRANSNRSGTTPAHDWTNWPGAAAALVERLQGVVIENKDAVRVIEQQDGDETLHYIDPPYVPETRDAGGDYAHEMSVSDHQALLSVIQQLRGHVVLSGYRSDMYDSALRGWTRVERKAHADGARARIECLWMNFSANQGQLFA